MFDYYDISDVVFEGNSCGEVSVEIQNHVLYFIWHVVIFQNLHNEVVVNFTKYISEI